MSATPGPWIVSIARAGQVGVYAAGNAYAGALVAYCETTPQTSEVQRDANANLISKAWLLPEMAEALRQSLKAWERREPWQVDAACTAARSVLAKYESEEP